jgi:hypothetical protein
MTRVLTEADALADLNGTPRPGDLPSVGTEDAIVSHYTDQVMQVVNDMPMDAARTQWGIDACEMLRDLIAERDKLAERVAALEEALQVARDWLVDGYHHPEWSYDRIDAAITGATK